MRFLVSVFIFGLAVSLVSCANDTNNATPTGSDQPTANATPTPTPGPTSTPSPTPPPNVDQPWDKVTLDRYVSATNCYSVFTVYDRGGWSWEHCADTNDSTFDSRGSLTATEQAELERRATAALRATTRPDACDDMLITDRDYVQLNDEDGTLMRDFRPNNSCHMGGEREVPALRSYIRMLRAKYTTQF